MGFFSDVGRKIKRSFKRLTRSVRSTLLGGDESSSVPQVPSPKPPPPLPEQAFFGDEQRRFRRRRRSATAETLLTGPLGLTGQAATRRKTLLGQ